MTRQESIIKAAAAAKIKNTKYNHPDKRKIKDMRGNMIKRCYDENCRSFKTYGARGITVCEEWIKNPESFYNWALANGWNKALTIERKNVNLGYSPENCCFITPMEQQQNTTRSHFLEWNGEKLTVSAWARKLGIRQQALSHRVERGWPIDRIFTQPFRGRN